MVAAADLAAALGGGADVAVVSVIYANNEVGAIQPLAALGERCRRLGVPLHTDAVQAVGKLPLDVGALQVDALSGGARSPSPWLSLFAQWRPLLADTSRWQP